MNILLLEQPDAADIQSGHNRQLINTHTYLKQLGVNVSISKEINPDLSSIDLVHSFSANMDQFVHILRNNKKYVISPVFWAKHYLLSYGNGFGLWKLFRRKVRLFMASLTFINEMAFDSYQSVYNYFLYLRFAEHLLPNSTLEINQIHTDLGISKDKMTAVPNAVDQYYSILETENLFYQKYGTKDYILMVGRIEPHKNQLGLVKATKSFNIPIVLVGQLRECHEAYFREVKKINPRVIHIPELKGEMLVSAYQHARLHILPSFFETTGLVTLEAAMTGTKVISTNQGYTREYFEDFIEYCDPYDIASIKSSILKTLNQTDTSKLEHLKEKIIKEYSWEQTAKQTLAVYNKVLGIND